MKISQISIGMLLSLCASLVGCQTTNNSASPSSVESSETKQVSVSGESSQFGQDNAQASLETKVVSTILKRLHTRFSRSHLNQSLSDSEREQNTFNSIVEIEITAKCLFTPAEVQSLREKTQSEMINEASQGTFKHGNALFIAIDERHLEKLTYQTHLLNINNNLVTDAPSDLVACWQHQFEEDRQWLEYMGYDSDTAKTFLNRSYESKREALISQSLRQRAERWAVAYAKGYGPSNGYLPGYQGPEFINGDEGIGVMLKSHRYGAEVIANSYVAVNPDLIDGDILVAYADNQQAMVPFINTPLNRIIALIRGEPGSQIKLRVYRPTTGEIRTVQASRDKSARKPGVSYTLEADSQVALVRLTSITVGVSDELVAISHKLQQQDIDTLILDLRGNGGGALSELSKIFGVFGVNGEAYLVNSIYRTTSQQAEQIAQPFSGKVIVLVDQDTGSGAEMLAATLQDYGRAIVIGENTYGLGTVQQYRSLDHIYDMFNDKLGYVGYTIATLHRVDGTLLHNQGVTPDVIIPQGKRKNNKIEDMDIDDIDTDWTQNHRQDAEIIELQKHYSYLQQSQFSKEETTTLAIEMAKALANS